MENLKVLTEIISSTELAIPLFQMILLLVASTSLLFFGKVKAALIVNYLFTFYWGYIFNKDHLIECFQSKMNCMIYLYFYFGLGFVILVLALLAFLAPE